MFVFLTLAFFICCFVACICFISFWLFALAGSTWGILLSFFFFLISTECSVLIDSLVDLEAEKLKKNKTCFNCKYHFMSDCYLECDIYGLLRDDTICGDFKEIKKKGGRNVNHKKQLK